MISVCMATYNGERFLREQVDSILCQLGPDDELIISDDGSTDGTLGIIESYNDSRIRLLHHEKENNSYFKQTSVLCATQNFCNALRYVSGEYIFLADQDDVWHKDKIQICVEQLKNSCFVMSNFSIIDENGVQGTELFYSENPFKKTVVSNLLYPHFIGCCCCFRKEILQRVLPVSERVYSHDLWIGIVAIHFYDVCFLDIPLIQHRVHSSNASLACKKTNNSLLFRLKYRFLILIELLKLGIASR